jgi:hypothetical protein
LCRPEERIPEKGSCGIAERDKECWASDSWLVFWRGNASIRSNAPGHFPL